MLKRESLGTGAAGTGAGSRSLFHGVGKPSGMFCFHCTEVAVLRQQFRCSCHRSRRLVAPWVSLICSARAAVTRSATTAAFFGTARPGARCVILLRGVLGVLSRREVQSWLGVTLRCSTIPIHYLVFFSFFFFNLPHIVFLFPLLWLCFCVEGNTWDNGKVPPGV